MMVNNKIETAASTVIAMAQEDNRLRAVCLEGYGGNFKILWLKSSEAGQVDWRSFAAECGLFTEQTGQIKKDDNTTIVVGYDSSTVVFHRINVPVVEKEEIDAMVKLQAETLLPLPVEQVELAWRAGRPRGTQRAVTIAAAKRASLEKFVEQIRQFKPTKIILDCEGIARVWKEFFSATQPKTAVLLSISLRKTQICLVEDGQLSNAASLDMGLRDFSAAEGLANAVQTIERFAQDTRGVLELFGFAQPADVPVFVLSDGNVGNPSMDVITQRESVIKKVVSCLGTAGLNVEIAPPQVNRLKAQDELQQADGIYEYRVPIGLGLMTLDSGTKRLDIFERLYSPAKKREKQSWIHSPKVTGTIAVLMLVVFMIAFYVSDATGLAVIESHLSNSRQNADYNLVMQRQKLVKAIASQRPDMLGLLDKINSIESKEILLDSLHFDIGRPVRITGQTKIAEKMYDFEKSLQGIKAIEEVKIQSAPEDSKSKKLKFTITFHYKNFTRKRNL